MHNVCLCAAAKGPGDGKVVNWSLMVTAGREKLGMSAEDDLSAGKGRWRAGYTC